MGSSGVIQSVFTTLQAFARNVIVLSKVMKRTNRIPHNVITVVFKIDFHSSQSTVGFIRSTFDGLRQGDKEKFCCLKDVK